MNSVCRILPFRSPKGQKTLSRQECSAIAAQFLGASAEGRDFDAISDPDVLLALCANLREKVEVEPSAVFSESTTLFHFLERADITIGVFDERDYLLGEFALLAAKSGRHLGKTEETERWLDRSESFFRLTINPAPQLASAAYLRLALRYEMRKFDEVLEHAPVLSKTFERLGMTADAAKTRFLQSVALKVIGRGNEAFQIASALSMSTELQEQPALLGQVWSEIGEYHSSGRDFPAAINAFGKAVGLLKRANRPVALMSLKLSLGEMFRLQGQLREAYEAFRSAGDDARALGMPTYVAYSHVLAAEALLALDRPREAEWEVFAALPLLQAHRMVPESFAAVAVLKESVERRKTDAGALKTVREFLQANA